MIHSQFEYTTKVKDIWVDHNGHMNDAEYNRVFSDATDAWLAYLGLDKETIAQKQYTVFTLENHVMYLKEIKVDEYISVNVELYDYDAKRLHVFMTLTDANQSRCATYEVMLMGMNTAVDKPEAFPEMIKKRLKIMLLSIRLKISPKSLVI